MPPTPPSLSGPSAHAEAAISAAWEAVDRDFEDPSTHDRVLALATQLDALALVAARYKEAAQREDRRATADAQRARIVALALARLDVRAPQSEVPARVVRMLRVLAFVFLVISVALFVRAVFR